MKKMRFFAAICLLVFAAFVSAQSITPLQLKEARMAVYQWVRDYKNYARMEEKRNPRQKFVALFISDSIQLVNDYLPSIDKRGDVISVGDYADVLLSKENFYKMSFDIKNANISSEKKHNENTIRYVVELDKYVNFAESGNLSDFFYAYPQTKYRAIIEINYYLNEAKALAMSIKGEESFGNIIVLHDEQADEVNRYTTSKELKSICSTNSTPLVYYEPKTTDFDSQMVLIKQDTLKNCVHLGAGIGSSFYVATINDEEISNFVREIGLASAFQFGYYRQLMMRGGNRLGLDISAAFAQRNMGLAGDYKTSYHTVDPDGGNYDRIITLNNYEEVVKSYSVELPISLRYDYFIRKDVSIYGMAGVNVSYDLWQIVHAVANAEYAGYYDWLFGVTLNQNGIYDFGSYQLNKRGKETAIGNLGVGVIAGIGLQYFIPASKWSINTGVHYDITVHNKLSKPRNFVISHSIDDWNSATNKFSSFYAQRFLFKVQFNYNF